MDSGGEVVVVRPDEVALIQREQTLVGVLVCLNHQINALDVEQILQAGREEVVRKQNLSVSLRGVNGKQTLDIFTEDVNIKFTKCQHLIENENEN